MPTIEPSLKCHQLILGRNMWIENWRRFGLLVINYQNRISILPFGDTPDSSMLFLIHLLISYKKCSTDSNFQETYISEYQAEPSAYKSEALEYFNVTVYFYISKKRP